MVEEDGPAIGLAVGELCHHIRQWNSVKALFEFTRECECDSNTQCFLEVERDYAAEVDKP